MRSDATRILRGILTRNRGLKLLALVLSVILWWFVAGESKVLVGVNVPLEVRNIPPGMTITNKLDQQVEVRLTGPPSLLGAMSKSDVTAAIDLSQARQGRQSVHLGEAGITVPAGIRVQRIYPNIVEVVLEKLERREVPVVAKIGGALQVRRRVARVEVSPAKLEVEALPEEHSRIHSLVTEEIAPEVATGVFSTRARVDLREGHAKIVGNPTVRVTVHFR